MEYGFLTRGTGSARGTNDTCVSMGNADSTPARTNCPIDIMDDQILDPEPDIIDLDSDDETIQMLKDMIIVSDDFD